AICSFEKIDDAVDSVIATIQSGVPIARIELLDEVQVDAVNRYSGLTLPVHPLLLLEFHGTAAGVQEQAELVQSIATEHNGQDFQWAADPSERNRLWQARHDAAFAALALRP